MVLPPEKVSVTTIPTDPIITPTRTPTTTSPPVTIRPPPRTPIVPPRPRPTVPTAPTIPPPGDNVPERTIAVIVSPNRNKHSPKTVKINNLHRGSIASTVTCRITEVLRRDKTRIILAHSSSQRVSLTPQIRVTRQTGTSLFIDVRTGSVDLDEPRMGKLRACCRDSNGHLTRIVRRSVLHLIAVHSHKIHRTHFRILMGASVPTILIRAKFIAKTRSTHGFGSPT